MDRGQEVIVLGVKRYSFTNKDTGELIEGTQILYVEDFSYPFNESNMKGIFPMTISHSSKTFYDKFNVLPGYYRIILKQRPDIKGRPIPVPIDVKFIRAFNENKIDTK